MGAVIVTDFEEPIELTVGATPQNVFSFAFPFWDVSDVVVSVGGLQLDPSAYTVLGQYVQNGQPVTGGFGSGVITLNVAVVNTIVSIDRYVQPLRDSAYSSTGPLPPSALNTDLNRLTARMQDLRRILSQIVPSAPSYATLLALIQQLQREVAQLAGLIGLANPLFGKTTFVPVFRFGATDQSPQQAEPFMGEVRTFGPVAQVGLKIVLMERTAAGLSDQATISGLPALADSGVPIVVPLRVQGAPQGVYGLLQEDVLTLWNGENPLTYSDCADTLAIETAFTFFTPIGP